jgi:tetratricopeptide (TPR) repeat protein
MNHKSFLIPLVLTLLVFDPELCSAQKSNQCLGLITGLSGNVLVRKADKNEFVKTCWGTQLFDGDQIKTATNSEATLTLYNKNLIKLGSNSIITISDNKDYSTESGATVKKISAATMINLSDLTQKKNNKKEEGALAGLRAVDLSNEQKIELTSPFNSLIKTNRPSFSWTSKKSFENYTINLYTTKGLLWSKKVTGNTLNYPAEEKELEFGSSYFWNVEGQELINTFKSSSQQFSILSAEKLKEIEGQVAIIKNSFIDEKDGSSMHSVLGAYYMNQGLLQDAIGEFQTISKINSDAPLPHEILGSLYTDVGNKDKAIEELQKALTLAKK